jgi:hypothetical protein
VTHTDAMMATLQPEAVYAAWLDASNPVTAILTWDTITLVAHGTSGAHGEVRRGTRGAAINARKRAIERFPWADSDSRPVTVSLKLVSKRYSETHGFMHASYFTYKVTRS